MEIAGSSATSEPTRRNQRSRAAYRSPLRQERAGETRLRITTAAQELFRTQGFTATTITDIAAASGVAAQTVYAAFKSKGGIVQALLAELEEDADAARWRQRVEQAATPALMLAAFAQWTAALFSTSRVTLLASREAIGDPTILALQDEGDRHRRAGVTALVRRLAEAGGLHPSVTEALAVDRMWMLTGLELYLSATTGCGWSDEEYATWLADLLVQQLLPR